MTKEEQSTVGGIAFFSSLSMLPLVILGNLLFLVPLLDSAALAYWLTFLGCFWIGLTFTRLCVQGRSVVFLHELKHAILSSFAGNREKKMEVRSRSGKFAYEYSKGTAAYNAFISLAPYMLPLFSFVALGLGAICLRNVRPIWVCLVGLAAGVDTDLARRDVGPYQTDISLIRGGYRIGFAYIILMNAAQFSFLAAWISHGFYGLRQLFLGWWGLALAVTELLGYGR